MVTPVNVRISDRIHLTQNQGDFVVRNRHPRLYQVYLLCFLPLVVVIMTSTLIYNQMLYGGLVCLMVGIVTLFFALQTRKHQAILNSSEFLAALLAAALTYDHKFCTIVRDSNEIVYLDRGFQQMFPAFISQPGRTLDTLLSMYKLSADGKAKLMDIFKQNIHASLTVPMESGDGKQAGNIQLFIDPIKRGQGYVLLRGK